MTKPCWSSVVLRTAFKNERVLGARTQGLWSLLELVLRKTYWGVDTATYHTHLPLLPASDMGSSHGSRLFSTQCASILWKSKMGLSGKWLTGQQTSWHPTYINNNKATYIMWWYFFLGLIFPPFPLSLVFTQMILMSSRITSCYKITPSNVNV